MPKTPIDIKIAYIGGGSRYWAQMVMTDLALCPHLTGEIALYDINYDAALKNVERAKAIYGHPEARTTFEVNAYHTPEQVFVDADFVFLSILPGPMQMFANDIDIPKAYGILQSVGDTTGPGGISRALRTVPTYVEYAHQIMEHCPDAWVINYTNPMTLCTAALYAAEPEIKAFGCCHEVFGTQHMLAELVHERMDVPMPRRQEIRTDVAGVNHFTFVPRAAWQGEDLYPLLYDHMQQDGFWDDRTEWSEMAKAQGLWFSSQRLIAFDFLRNFGVLGAAGDRHLAEFVPWYLTTGSRPQPLRRHPDAVQLQAGDVAAAAECAGRCGSCASRGGCQVDLLGRGRRPADAGPAGRRAAGHQRQPPQLRTDA